MVASYKTPKAESHLLSQLPWNLSLQLVNWSYGPEPCLPKQLKCRYHIGRLEFNTDIFQEANSKLNTIILMRRISAL